ncbi:uncharacterized protein LOC141534812 [Cotesia typhae]|uniref:uncharacterized protein LOC141534812 n=1 Tax=Cotesia typhae TaxID=2053667 RepID=UPI003D69D702
MTDQMTELNKFGERLTNLETSFKLIGSSASRDIEKPECLPFKTHEDIIKYDSASDKERKKMMSYLQFYDMKNNVKDNIREIFSRNRLFTDSLLTNIIWVGKRDSRQKKLLS